MGITRRELLRNSALAAPGLYFLGPHLMMRAAWGSPAAGVRNIVFLELDGGNDGINTIVPFGVDAGAYYNVYRTTLALPENALLQVNSEVAFNPGMASLKAHFDAGRLAVIQGVSYSNPNFSHDVASGIVDTGTPATPYGPGWIGRYVASLPANPVPYALDASSSNMDGILAGSGTLVPAIKSVSEFVLPQDSKYSGDKTNRKVAYQAMAVGLSSAGGSSQALAETTLDIVNLVDAFKAVPAYTPTGTYPSGSLGKALKLVAQLLEANFGVRMFHVSYGGFDSHSEQEKDGYHTNRLQLVSDNLSAFQTDLAALGLADDTIVVVYTEFGRTVYENGSKGTDHGTVFPIFVLGNPVVGGLTTPHPSMDPGNLTSKKQPPMVVDVRDVWGTILSKWLNGSVAQVFPGWGFNDLGFLG